MQSNPWLALGAAALMAVLGAGCGSEDTPEIDAGTGGDAGAGGGDAGGEGDAGTGGMGSGVRVLAMGIIEPVSLRIQDSQGEEELLNVQQDGELAFPGGLAAGESFTITFAADAGNCVLEGATGIIAADTPQVVLICPLLDTLQLVAARAPGGAVSPTARSYEMNVPLMAEALSVTATASRSDIEITAADLAVTSGQPSAAIPLALGANEIAVVARHQPSGATVRQVLTVHRAEAIAQQVYGKASNETANQFGSSVALSASGDTLAVGAPFESGQVGLSGAVYIFIWTGQSWSQQAYFKASNPGYEDYFGSSVALSATGDTLAVGAVGEDSQATGINGNQMDNSASSSGAAYVFTRTGQSWSQQAYVKASNTSTEDYFGATVALSATGDTLAVGAYLEDSLGTGIDGDQTNPSPGFDSGAAYVFTRTGQSWSQQAYVKASNTEINDRFGASVALSGTGDTLAVGAWGEASEATGVNGNQADNSASSSGAVYVFTRTGQSWSQQAYVKASNTRADGSTPYFGASVALSGTGDTLAVGAWGERSAATGIDGDQADDSAILSGAVYVFTRAGQSWSQQVYVKASNTAPYDFFGKSVALSGTGDTLAVSANGEDSQATGIDGDQSVNRAQDSGAVYVFTRTGQSWSQQTYVKASNTDANDNFGLSVALSATGDTMAVAAPNEASGALGIDGDQADDSFPGNGAVYLFY